MPSLPPVHNERGRESLTDLQRTLETTSRTEPALINDESSASIICIRNNNGNQIKALEEKSL